MQARTRIQNPTYHAGSVYNLCGKVHFPEPDHLLIGIFNGGIIPLEELVQHKLSSQCSLPNGPKSQHRHLPLHLEIYMLEPVSMIVLTPRKDPSFRVSSVKFQ